ncbi:MAG TPA: hypothetical protein VF912_09260 [Anaeromyxobacter sp.]
MLRPLAAASAALFLAACGSSSSSPAPSTPPSFQGTVLGQPFTPADASALVLGQATCSFEGTTASATGLVIGFGSFSGLCSLVTQTLSCGTKANATIVNVLLVRANVAGQTAPAVQPGTFPIGGAGPTPDAQGNLTVAQAFITKTDATCGEPAGTPVATSGTVRIDTIGARVTGSADLTFPDGGRVAGTFDVLTCGFQTDICTALSGSSCPTQTCVQ